MAKSKSILKLQGTMDGLTFVNSRTYKDHVRAKRGTHKKATVNDTLKEESARLMKANGFASAIKTAIFAHSGELPHGQLWQHLVSMFRKQIIEHTTPAFKWLIPFNVSEKYPFERFITAQPEIKVDKKKKMLTVRLQDYDHPSFRRSKRIDGYRIGLVAMFPGERPKKVKDGKVEYPVNTKVKYTKVISLEKEYSAARLQVSIPRNATCCVVALRVEGCCKGTVNDTPATQGMRVVKVVSIKR